jgi:hypothetical protein
MRKAASADSECSVRLFGCRQCPVGEENAKAIPDHRKARVPAVDVMRAVNELPGATAQKIAAYLAIPKTAAQTALVRLSGLGAVMSENRSGGRSRVERWWPA